MAKRIIVITLCLFFACLLFAAGGQEEGGAASTTQAKPQGTEPNTMPIVEPGSYTLTIAQPDTWWTETSYNNDLPVWQAIQERTGITVNWEVHPGNQAETNLQIRLASGQNLPDLIHLPGGVGDSVRYAQDELILPMNDLIQYYAPNIQKLFGKYPDLKKGHIAPDGEIYFLANYITGLPNGLGVLLRRDFVEAVGEELPETIDDWYRLLTKFKNTDLNGEGAGDVIPFGGHLGYFLSGFGMVSCNFGQVNNVNATQYWSDENGDVYFFALHPRFKEFLEFCNTLYEEELMDPMYGAGESMIGTLRQQNKVACYTAYPGGQGPHDAQLDRLGFPDADHLTILPPKDENGQSKLSVLNFCRNTQRWSITKDAADPKVVMKFLDYTYASTEGTRYLMCGFEGEQYDIVDGVLQFKEEMFTNPNYNIIALLRQIGAFECYMDCQPAEFNNARLKGKFKEALVAIDESGIAARYPIIIPTADEQEEIVNLSQDINSYIDEMTILFVTGRKPLSEFDDFIEELKGMGIDDLIEIYQGQYDRYTHG